MEGFRIDLKTFLGLAKPNQYSQSVISSWFWCDNFGPKSPNLHDPCTTVLYDYVHLAPSVVLKGNELLTVKGFRPHGLLVCRLCLPPDTPIIFHKGSYGYRYLKTVRRKHPDRLADSCKHSSVNQMAAGSTLQV